MDWEAQQDVEEIRASNWLNQHGHGKDLLALTESLVRELSLTIPRAAQLARDWMMYRV